MLLIFVFDTFTKSLIIIAKNVIVSKLETNRDLLEVSMNKTSSKGYFILSITFFLVSLIWFFGVKNTGGGIVWVCVAMVELVIAFISKYKEKNRQ